MNLVLVTLVKTVEGVILGDLIVDFHSYCLTRFVQPTPRNVFYCVPSSPQHYYWRTVSHHVLNRLSMAFY